MHNWARLEANAGWTKVYLYFFIHQPPVQTNAGAGNLAPTKHGSAVHTSEIPYVFNNLTGNHEWTAVDRQVADAMSSYWVNFAANGDPNGKGLPKWPAMDEKTSSAMNFGDTPKAGPAPLNEAQVASFEAYFDKLYGK